MSVKSMLFFLCVFCTSFAAVAQTAAPSLPGLPLTEEEAALVIAPDLVQPIVDAVRPFFLKLNFLVGGIFGLYLIFVIARIHYERKKVKLLEQIRYDLDQMNIHSKIPSSRERVGPLRRAWRWVKSTVSGKR